MKELKAVDVGVKKLYHIVQDGADAVESEMLQDMTLYLGKSAEKLSQGLELLAKEVDGFFQIVLTKRDVLFGNLTVGNYISN